MWTNNNKVCFRWPTLINFFKVSLSFLPLIFSLLVFIIISFFYEKYTQEKWLKNLAMDAENRREKNCIKKSFFECKYCSGTSILLCWLNRDKIFGFFEKFIRIGRFFVNDILMYYAIAKQYSKWLKCNKFFASSS